MPMVRAFPSSFTVAGLFLCAAALCFAQTSSGPVSIKDLKDGPVTVQGTVRCDAPVTAPLSGTRAALVRTEARLSQSDGSHTVGPKKGAKELAADFTVTDGTGTVKVFAKAAKPEQLKWKADAWDQEVTRSGRKMTQDGQRAIRSMMGEPEAMGLLSTTGEVVVREAWIAPEQTVTIRGVYKSSPAPGIYPVDGGSLTIEAPTAKSGGSGGGIPTWAIGAGVAVLVIGALLFLKK